MSAIFFWAALTIILAAYISYEKLLKETGLSAQANQSRKGAEEAPDSVDWAGSYQVVVVVNKDLGMTKGKVLSQFGHGIDALNEQLLKHPKLHRAWRMKGSAKIVVKGTEKELSKAYIEAKKKGLVCIKIIDAGRTQVENGSNTVIVIGPATKKELENVTGHLQLY